MQEITGDIWEHFDANPESWLVITTNHYITKRGEVVMGRGIALQTKQRYEGFARRFAHEVSKHQDRRVHIFQNERIICFQVKNTWWQDARLILIEQSARELHAWMQDNPEAKVYMVRPGCGNGHLKWEDVRPVLWKYFEHNPNVVIVERST